MNIIEKLNTENLQYRYNFGQDEISNCDIVNVIKDIKIIEKFYNSIEYKINNIDDYINFLFIEFFSDISRYISQVKSSYITDIEKVEEIIIKIKEKYSLVDEKRYINKNYKKILEYNTNEENKSEESFIDIHIRFQLRKKTIIKIAKYFQNNNEIIKYLLNNEVILFFDNIDLFEKRNKYFINKLADESIIKKLLNYRYIQLLEYLSKESILFKENPNYTIIIDNLINNINTENKHVYQKEKECEYLLNFLKNIKEIKARKVEKIYNKLLNELRKELERTGHEYKQSIDLEKVIKEYKKILKDLKNYDFLKLIYPNTISKNGRKYMGIENVDKIESGLTSIFLDEDIYYTHIRKMYVEQIIIPLFNNFFFDYAIKSIGYRRLEKLIINLINEIFSTMFIEYDVEEIKNDVKGIMFSIKNCYKKYKSKAETNYMYYINSVYVISYIEKLIRKIYVAVYEEKIYINDRKITLGSIFHESDDKKLNCLIGENLFKWIKYFLFNIRTQEKSFDNDIGYAYRNRMCHYNDITATSDLSNTIYYRAIYLFINLIIALHFNIYDYPSENTEEIIIKQFKKNE